ncbi:hypothetical protein ACFPOI_38720 [Nonomuraea angiospora]|uniref:Integrase n=1 Tax=Nonomuraea angiospora TaxID=46172 RepID=A0ABR9M168_9ACTN|nr:hypothetical protein [Nonomuraea angiospora]MBE1586332.1 integrase [Nonomuraea angiospora]
MVAIPPEILSDLRRHLERYAEPGENGHVFIGPKGGLLRRSAFRRIWNKVQIKVGLPDLHFHDLRQAIAQALGKALKGARKEHGKKTSGTQRARKINKN